MDFNEIDVRVLGCLIAKGATTPASYPLTSKALVSACNQSSNREPVVDYDEPAIDAAMMRLREGGFARTVRVTGNRVRKHRHVADEAWSVGPDVLAVLAVLMLRGPQTSAEIRSRTERYDVGLDTDDVEEILDALSARPEPLATKLERRKGERGVRAAHLLLDESVATTTGAAPVAPRAPVTAAPAEASPATGSTAHEPSAPSTPPDGSEAVGDVAGGSGEVDRVARLETEVAVMGSELRELRERVERLVRDLGAD